MGQEPEEGFQNVWDCEKRWAGSEYERQDDGAFSRELGERSVRGMLRPGGRKGLFYEGCTVASITTTQEKEEEKAWTHHLLYQ